MGESMSNSDTAAPPRIGGEKEQKRGLPGLIDFGKAVGSSLRDLLARIGLRISFWSVVGAAALTSSVYYFVFAESLYDSQAIISIQNKGSSSAGVGSILGSALGSGATVGETTQVYQYIYSMDMLRILDKKFHLRASYSSPDRNPFWRLWWPSVDEDFLWFYQNMVLIDSQTDIGLMTIDVLDYDRERSHALSETIVAEAEKFMNGINGKMQAQTMRFARDELSKAVTAVRTAKSPEELSVAEMRLTAAQQALAAAEGAANQQQVFIVSIASPSLPTETTKPERLFDILTITFVTALVYAVGFLMWSNVRDHRKA
jgi:capsule polysaccharide export protein KpsE/RkpR